MIIRPDWSNSRASSKRLRYRCHRMRHLTPSGTPGWVSKKSKRSRPAMPADQDRWSPKLTTFRQWCSLLDRTLLCNNRTLLCNTSATDVAWRASGLAIHHPHIHDVCALLGQSGANFRPHLRERWSQASRRLKARIASRMTLQRRPARGRRYGLGQSAGSDRPSRRTTHGRVA